MLSLCCWNMGSDMAEYLDGVDGGCGLYRYSIFLDRSGLLGIGRWWCFDGVLSFSWVWRLEVGLRGGGREGRSGVVESCGGWRLDERCCDD